MTTTRVRGAHRVFDMQHVHRDLRRHSVRGAVATMVSQAGMFCVQVLGLAVLARLLAPADFGVFGKTVALTGFITVLRSGGLSLATVQRAEITHEQVSTLFWLNLVLGIVAAAALSALSPLMAWFYRDPRVLWLVVAVAGSVVIDSMITQHAALMQRQMRFATLGSISVTGRVAGFLVAIGSAWLGAGYWALALQFYGSSLTRLVLTMWYCRWVPGLPRRGTGVRPMVTMGANQSGFNVLNFANRNMDNILIGRFVSDVALGFYSQAYRLLLLPVQQINTPISSVVIPALSRLQHEPERFARFYYRALSTVTFLGMPIVCFLLVDAESVIRLVLGERWLPVVPIFQALGIAAFAGTFGVAGGWVYSSLGRTDRQLRQQLVVCPITIMAFFLGLPWGALGVAVSFSVTRLFLSFPTLAYCYRGTPVNMRMTTITLARPGSASILAGAALWGARSLVAPSASAAWILLDGLFYGVVYLAIWYAIPGGRTHLKQLLTVLDELKPKRNQARHEPASDLDPSSASPERTQPAAAVQAPRREGVPATGDRRR